MAGMIPEDFERLVAMGLLIFYMADFIYTMRMQLRDDYDDDDTSMIGRLKVY